MTKKTKKGSVSLNTAAIPANPIIAWRHLSPSLLILGIPILLAFASIAIQNWNIVFDDAYISYRYAQNLALGHGITWNPGFPPTEGYTNFLLVLILAPFIKAGLDPLSVTRTLSFFCVIGIAGILFAIARRQLNCSATVAGMVAAIIFLVPATEVLCLVGLETVIYAFFLLITFIAGVVFIERKQLGLSVVFGCLLFLTMLLRPEATLLYPIMAITFMVEAVKYKSGLKSLLIGLLTLLALGGIYLAWKYLHFGRFLPNPFYLKASGQAFVSPYGLQSVMTFMADYALLLFLAFLGVILILPAGRAEQRRNKIAALAGSAFVVVYSLFFIHVDTLMDAYGRFLYPLVPLIILLAMPAFARILGFFESASKHKVWALPGLMVAFLLVFAPGDIFRFYDRVTWLALYHNAQTNRSAMGKELHIAKVLARFPQIEEVRVAFADAGVIPYFTRALWLDVAGLNDGFIARTRERSRLVDYFFDWSPDLVIHPGKAEQSWFQAGHGVLGDYLSWSNDPRWDTYEYVGTSKMNDIPYDLQYFVKKSSRFRDPLEAFLKANIVDGWYDPFPLPIGTYNPGAIPVTWRQH